MSVAELAAAIGVSSARVYQYEGGEDPTLDRLQRIAVALGINVRLLLDGPDLSDENADKNRAE